MRIKNVIMTALVSFDDDDLSFHLIFPLYLIRKWLKDASVHADATKVHQEHVVDNLD